MILGLEHPTRALPSTSGSQDSIKGIGSRVEPVFGLYIAPSHPDKTAQYQNCFTEKLKITRSGLHEKVVFIQPPKRSAREVLGLRQPSAEVSKRASF